MLLLFNSCTNSNSTEINTEEIEETTLKPNPTHGLRAVSLEEHELNIHVYVPEKFYEDEEGYPRYVQPNIIHNTGEARWEITLPGNRRWHLVIEEMGEDSSSIKSEISRLKAVDFFAYNFKEKNQNYIVYTRTLKAENTTLDSNQLSGLPNYHFYCNRTINDYNLVFKNFEMKDFRKLTIEKMLISSNNAY